MTRVPRNPPSHDVDRLEAGRRLFARSCRFIAGAAALDQIPDSPWPEVAFAGRSNVGKSSLINALVGQRAIACTSRTPGRTQQINFFLVGRALMLADLPGYGYANAPKTRIARWTHLVESYLRGRMPLRRICLLIDARHGIKESDREVMALLDEAAQSYQVVLTKADCVVGPALAARVADIATRIAKHPAAHPEVAATSARTGLGVPELRAALAALALD
jgi:GTP-binding protein